jgi:proteasome lid subunit RPN8/RPN11
MEEPFEIKIGQEIREEVPVRVPRLDQMGHQVWGNPDPDALGIIFGQQVYELTVRHGVSDLRREVGGILLGYAYKYQGRTYVDICASLPAPATHSSATHLTFTTDTWSLIDQERRARFPTLRVVGWYHTHPRMNVFVSGDDTFLHRNFFSEPWQVALVLEPDKHLGGFFVNSGNRLAPAAGFYELFDTHPHSVITWRNIAASAPAVAAPPRTRRALPVRCEPRRHATWMRLGLLILLLAIGVLRSRRAERDSSEGGDGRMEHP